MVRLSERGELRMIARRLGKPSPPTEIYLYNEGDKCTSITGDFTFVRVDGTATGSITYGASYVEIRCPQWSAYVFATVNSINYPQYSHINIQYSYGSLGSYANLYCAETSIIFNRVVQIPSPACLDKSYAGEPVIININNTGSGYIRIHKIWLSN